MDDYAPLWDDCCAEQLHTADGPGGAANSVIPALPPSDRRSYMNTPRARDLHPSDVLPHADRFGKFVERGAGDACWLWTGYKDRLGYGKFRVSPTVLSAHRVSYVLETGESLVGGLVVDHLCRVPSCVNPRHLEPVTDLQNTWRGLVARRPDRYHSLRSVGLS